MGTCASTGARSIAQEAQKESGSTNSARTETDNGAHKIQRVSPFPETEVRVMIIGKIGNGKSSLGNTLLQEEVFGVDSAMGATTKTCLWEQRFIDGINLSVTDTPGFTELSKDEILKELSKSFVLSCPGPHVVIMVLRCDRPFTKEEHAIVMTLLDLLVDKDRRFLMIVFAGGDRLPTSDEGMQLALQKKLVMAPELLKEVLKESGTTYCAVDNTGLHGDEQRRNQARIVFSMIRTLFKRNNGEYFTNKRWVQYNQTVQAQIKHLQDTENLSTTEAENKVRNDVSEGSLWEEMLTIGKNYIVPIISAARGLASVLWS